MSSPDAPHSRSAPAAPLWPAVAFMASAGAAYLWWSQWGRAMVAHLPGTPAAKPIAPETASVIAPPAMSAPTPAETAPASPEQIMSHSPAPAAVGAEATDSSDALLTEPASELMAHAPPETVGVTMQADGRVIPTTMPAPALTPPPARKSKPAAEPTVSPASVFAPQSGDTSGAAMTAGVSQAVLSDAAAEAVNQALGIQGAAAVPTPKPRRKVPGSGPV